MRNVEMERSAASRWGSKTGIASGSGPLLLLHEIPSRGTTVLGDLKIGMREMRDEIAKYSIPMKALALVISIGLMFPVFLIYHLVFWASWERRLQNWSIKYRGEKTPPASLKLFSILEAVLWAAIPLSAYLMLSFIAYFLRN